MKRRMGIYNILGVVFLVLQLPGYLDSFLHPEPGNVDVAERWGGYLGFNFMLIVSVIFFISAAQLKKKIKQQENDQDIDSIGR